MEIWLCQQLHRRVCLSLERALSTHSLVMLQAPSRHWKTQPVRDHVLNCRHRTVFHQPHPSLLQSTISISRLMFAGQPSTRACFWCLGSGSLVACNHCPRCFCYNCYKQRHSYGIINWAKVLKESNLYCPVCTGKEPASNEGGERF